MLEVFRKAKVPSKLSTMMDTEADFNDATGIAVFTIILASTTFGKVSVISAASSFVVLFAGGALVGLIVAFLAELLASVMSDKLTQTILTISVVYGWYALASSLGVSGLIAVAVVGLYFGNFTIRTAMGPFNEGDDYPLLANRGFPRKLGRISLHWFQYRYLQNRGVNWSDSSSVSGGYCCQGCFCLSHSDDFRPV